MELGKPYDTVEAQIQSMHVFGPTHISIIQALSKQYKFSSHKDS